MIKHPRKLISYTLASGLENWALQGASVFLPETDVEIALRMFSLKNDEIELLIFNPLEIRLGAKTAIPENIPEEKEIPEKDR